MIRTVSGQFYIALGVLQPQKTFAWDREVQPPSQLSDVVQQTKSPCTS